MLEKNAKLNSQKNEGMKNKRETEKKKQQKNEQKIQKNCWLRSWSGQQRIGHALQLRAAIEIPSLTHVRPSPRSLSRLTAAEQLLEWDAAQHLIFAFPYLTFRSLAVFTFSFFFAIFPFDFFWQFPFFLLLFWHILFRPKLKLLFTMAFHLFFRSSNFSAIFRCPQLLPELPRRSLLISFGIFSSLPFVFSSLR